MSNYASVTALKREAASDEARVSDHIRARLRQAGQRYFANDNIARFIRDGELDVLRQEVECRMQELLEALVIDTQHDHNTTETAQRVARMFVDEVFRGRYEPAPSVTTFPNVSRVDQLMTIGPIKVRSACAHHLCPIVGKVWIGVLPNPASELIGLSKYTRICDWVMSRPQIQEEAVVMLADELERRVQPAGLGVVMEASHFCTHWRGVKDDGSRMRSTVMRGALSRDTSMRREFLDTLGRQDAWSRPPSAAGDPA